MPIISRLGPNQGPFPFGLRVRALATIGSTVVILRAGSGVRSPAFEVVGGDSLSRGRLPPFFRLLPFYLVLGLPTRGRREREPSEHSIPSNLV